VGFVYDGEYQVPYLGNIMADAVDFMRFVQKNVKGAEKASPLWLAVS
jgi:hypothetical protein